MDKQVSGEDRKFHIEQWLAGSYVYVQENIVEGFYLPGFGEGLITAKTGLTGTELMKYRFASKENIAFAIDNLHATEFMYSNHYTESRIAKRMRLGKKRVWQPENIPIAWIDKNIVDGLMNAIGNITRGIADMIKGFQSGKVQQYAMYFLVGAVLLAVLFIYVWH